MSRKLLALALLVGNLSPVVAQTARPLAPKPKSGLYLGADLSYANEMEDCDAVYRNGGKPVNPYRLLAAWGGNIVRVRIGNDAKWTRYSNLADITKTDRRARAAGMQVLLDFHYSDDRVDGEKQIPLAAWAKLDTDAQKKAFYTYTRDVLTRPDAAGLMPEMVQVGNETNLELVGGVKGRPIDWTRNATLLNAGMKAVRDAGARAKINPRVMLHIAETENVEPWFAAAAAAGVTDYDVIGISYYRKWSTRTMPQLGETIPAERKPYGKDVILVETAYPHTNEGADGAANLLGPDTLVPEYPATPAEQRAYLVDLTQTLVDNGGVGTIYWEPNWVPTRCKTRWGTESPWGNAAWFDLKSHEALPAFEFLKRNYSPRSRRAVR
ncbi:MAG: GH53 [uncultured Sphingomonadaceae bacterium]|uniref:Arabinogalactan endo-beta-1,4-galactanase n=1 Tax=uncultured Sphingomonadaceae bacterium TaxID=169976 RepID=A0A6J4TWQ3_9SPHN|nr:MAG: GH53 [uncultured Sphingomonadaceae bacterium]